MASPVTVVGPNGLQKAPSAVSVSSGNSSASPASTPRPVSIARPRAHDLTHDVVGVGHAERAVQGAQRGQLVVRVRLERRGDPDADAHLDQPRDGIDHAGVVPGTARRVVDRGIGGVEADLDGDVATGERRESPQHPRREERAVREQRDGRDVGQPREHVGHARHEQRLAAGDAEGVESERGASPAMRRIRSGSSSRRCERGDEPVRQ